MVYNMPLLETKIAPEFKQGKSFQYLSADSFPWLHPVHWLHSHFAVGGWSPLQRLSGMLTAHMTQIAPYSGFTWHPHRNLEIYTWVLEGKLYHEDSTGGKGTIQAGELQRMFAGNYIEHQELNMTAEPVRVIQIWYVADEQYRNLEPHYQQVDKASLPVQRKGDANVYSLIGDNSPMFYHIQGRLTATSVTAGGTTIVEAPQAGEDLFLYITDNDGTVQYGDEQHTLGIYDVILARADAQNITITAESECPLHYLSFYLPRFLN